MSKNYEALDELVPKTRELHRAIFDKGYEQGKRDVLCEIRAEVADIYCGQYCCESPLTADAMREHALEIIDKYIDESEEDNENL
jgi:hypothetical protein